MPFLRYAHYGSLLLLALMIVSVALPVGLPTWLGHIGTGLAIVVGLAFLLNLWLMIRDWRADHLFIIRNSTFYTGILTALILAWLLLRGQSGNELFASLRWWLAPLLLFHYLQQLSYVRFDAVRLDIKMGLSKAESIALFQLEDVNISLTNVELMLRDSRHYTLLKSYFSKKRWAVLTSKQEQLRQNLSND